MAFSPSRRPMPGQQVNLQVDSVPWWVLFTDGTNIHVTSDTQAQPRSPQPAHAASAVGPTSTEEGSGERQASAEPRGPQCLPAACRTSRSGCSTPLQGPVVRFYALFLNGCHNSQTE